MWLYTLLRANHNKARSLEAAMDQIEDNFVYGNLCFTDWSHSCIFVALCSVGVFIA